ncbi:MAG: S8 family serine peptidase [Deltaproteobacteria bacterium]|nr:S8 family serine peptidase [Deltaproteobacteria bacterium]
MSIRSTGMWSQGVLFFTGVLVACLLEPSSRAATPPHANRAVPHVDPRLELWPTLQKARGRSFTSGVPALIAFVAPPTAKALETLEQQGVRFSRRGDGSRRRVGRVYSARLAPGALEALRREPSVQSADLDRQILPLLRPLDRTVANIQATQVWNNTSTSGVDEDGAGVIIGSLDSGIDVFHPAFFRADGAIYSWIDVNNNGAFDPGVDGIDLNGDGQLGAKEQLTFFDGKAWDPTYSYNIVNSANNRYDAGFDYLYIDLDGDGHRSYGPSFGDATPTFGEPLFVADDVDGNGRLDVHEKVRALGTSKIRAVWFRGEVYRRGVNLSATPNEGYASSHGHGTSGILVGGQRGYMARVGIAPGADLVLAVDDSGVGEGLAWLVSDQHTDLVLHEYSQWMAMPLDGSTVVEQLMDEAASLGVPQVVPAGNLSGSGHTALLEIPAAQTRTLVFTAPSMSAPQGAVSSAVVSMHWRTSADALSVFLEDPAGKRAAASSANSGGEVWDNTTYLWSYRDDSSRGTARFDVVLQGTDGANAAPLRAGDWTLTLTNEGSRTMQLHAYIGDDVYGWGSGAVFAPGKPPASTVCWPSTADSAISVAAYAGRADEGFAHPSLPEPEGQLRAYSSRGIRVDGQRLLDIAAPDNPLVPANVFSIPEVGIEMGYGAYSVFGGTSGAGPHVAGAVALLLQHAPELGAEEVRARLHAGALVDSAVSAGPAEGWGAGKLRVYGAIHQRQAAPSTPPQVVILPPWAIYEQQPVEIAVQATDAEDAPASLELRWDADYDGHWDGAFAPVGALPMTFPEPGSYVLKVQVRDSSGLTGQALAHVDVLKTGAPPPPRPDAGSVSVEAGTRTDAGMPQLEVKGGCQLGGRVGGLPLVIIIFFGLGLCGRVRQRYTQRPKRH